jgi:hypothetical protein
MVRAGVDPGLLDEVSWWRTDDLWVWALEALDTYVRAAAAHGAETVPAICGRIASRTMSSSQPRPDLDAQIARPRPHRTRGGQVEDARRTAIWRRAADSDGRSRIGVLRYAMARRSA